jgi:hypothetical protein
MRRTATTGVKTTKRAARQRVPSGERKAVTEQRRERASAVAIRHITTNPDLESAWNSRALKRLSGLVARY